MENGSTNGKEDYEVGFKKPPEEHQFTSQNQPDPKAKSKGWERKRRAKEIMDKILEIQNMSVQEYIELRQSVKTNPEKHTMLEQLLIGYVERLGRSDNLVKDFLDRHVPKATQEIDITSDGNPITGYTFEVVKPEHEKED